MGILRRVNLTLERMRFLFRIAVEARVMPRSGFETAVRQVDEVGRMLHGWREAITRRTAPVVTAATESL